MKWKMEYMKTDISTVLLLTNAIQPLNKGLGGYWQKPFAKVEMSKRTRWCVVLGWDYNKVQCLK